MNKSDAAAIPALSPVHLRTRIGRTHLCKALGTGRLDEAIRRSRLVAAEFEQRFREAEGAIPRCPGGAVDTT